MKYFDSFSGYGGFSLGIERAYENRNNNAQANGGSEKDSEGTDEIRKGLLPFSNERTIHSMDRNLQHSDGSRNKGDITCIGYSEIDKYASAVYKHHFGGKNYENITTIDPTELPDFDLFCGGFPCQAFSIAGKRRGFEETRGTLIFDVFRILKEKQPRFVLLENVKGLLSHDSGRTFKTIISSLAELGYSVEWQVLNAKNFGVPQNRERVFIIGHLGGFCGRQVFPIREANPTTLNYIGGILSEKNKLWLEDGKQLSRNFPQGSRVYSDKGISSTLASQAGGLGAKTGLYAVPVLTPDRLEKRQNGRRFKTDGEPMFTLNTQDKHGVYDGYKIRRLTPTECERLMGLPDDWTKYGDFDGEIKQISDSQRYKLAGNGVVINCVEEIIKRLFQ